MSVEILDSATIIDFVEDEEAFNSSVEAHFAHLDTNHDGTLSYAEMLTELQSLRVFDTHFGIDIKVEPEEVGATYGALFLQFDHNLNGAVDVQEFKAETKRMMLAVANGLGFLPVQMVLEQDSLLKTAVERELTKIVA
ncbi:Penta-EF hand domain-containing protein 2 [Bienertia sinuspersici]